jgi:hypothetical protein
MRSQFSGLLIKPKTWVGKLERLPTRLTRRSSQRSPDGTQWNPGFPCHLDGLKAREVAFLSVTESIDTTAPIGRTGRR